MEKLIDGINCGYRVRGAAAQLQAHIIQYIDNLSGVVLSFGVFITEYYFPRSKNQNGW
jgi:predicted GNAT family acetyltransferase